MSQTATVNRGEEPDLSAAEEAELDAVWDEIGRQIREGEFTPLPPLPELPAEDRVRRS